MDAPAPQSSISCSLSILLLSLLENHVLLIQTYSFESNEVSAFKNLKELGDGEIPPYPRNLF